MEFIGMAGKADMSDITAFIDDLDVGGFTHVIDDDGSLWAEFGVFTQPAWAFVNDDGTIEIVNGALGSDELSTRLDALVAS